MRLDDYFKTARKIAILGHVRPDGDCVGSCLALYHYIREQFPEAEPQVFLGEFAEDLRRILPGADQIRHDIPVGETWDLCVSLDASDEGRLGDFAVIFQQAKETFCIDHHITNPGFAKENVIDAKAAATAELLFTLLEEEKISSNMAICLYTGIVHDTGVFKYSNTTRRTMEAAGALLEKNVRSNEIIDGTFYHKSFVQNKLLGRSLLNAEFDHRMVFCILRLDEIQELGGTNMDLEGIVDQLRVTDGALCAAFVHETEPDVYKVSLRGNRWMDVSKVAAQFGGGGHVKAAGCTICGDVAVVREQLRAALLAELATCKPD